MTIKTISGFMTIIILTMTMATTTLVARITSCNFTIVITIVTILNLATIGMAITRIAFLLLLLLFDFLPLDFYCYVKAQRELI